MNRFDDDIVLPEDFRTNSDVHVFKLSDEEFSRRKSYLLDSCKIATEMQSKNRELRWSEDMERQYIMVLDKRQTISLPLPEPVSLNSLSKTDLLAVFSKMHSRAFSRSFRLSFVLNGLLEKNLTSFSVRIWSGLYSSWCGDGDGSNHIDRMISFDNKVTIRDATSILPFTFDLADGLWDAEFPGELLNKMKQPFINLHIKLNNDQPVRWKPWMINVDSVTFVKEADDNDGKLVKQMRPRMVWFAHGKDRLSRELWDSAEYIGGIRTDELGEIVQLWRSGNWKNKAIKFRGWKQTYAEVTSALKGCLFWIFGGLQLVFIPNPGNSFLVVHMLQNDKHGTALVDFNAYLGIQKVSDMLSIHSSPFDLSSYPLDPDLPFFPHAYCELLFAYRSKKCCSPWERLPLPLSQ